MWVAPARIESFLRQPDAACRSILIYGPDQSLVAERATALIRALGIDPADPFNVDVLSADVLGSDPARLYDAAAAQSLMGGDRVVRVTDAGENAKTVFKSFLADRPNGAVVIVQGGELKRRGDLVTLFEKGDGCAVIACYEDNDRDREAFILEMVKEAGLSIDHDALAWTAGNLATGRGTARREVEKLLLNAEPDGRITLVRAQEAVTSDYDAGSDDVIDAAAAGQLDSVVRLLRAAELEDAPVIGILRMTINHFMRLHDYRRAVDSGTPPDTVLKSQRPPVFFRRIEPLKRQIKLWSVPMIEQQLLALASAEAEAKRTNAPDRILLERTLFRIASTAARQR